jgi:hypothetical protein
MRMATPTYYGLELAVFPESQRKEPRAEREGNRRRPRPEPLRFCNLKAEE